MDRRQFIQNVGIGLGVLVLARCGAGGPASLSVHQLDAAAEGLEAIQLLRTHGIQFEKVTLPEPIIKQPGETRSAAAARVFKVTPREIGKTIVMTFKEPQGRFKDYAVFALGDHQLNTSDIRKKLTASQHGGIVYRGRRKRIEAITGHKIEDTPPFSRLETLVAPNVGWNADDFIYVQSGHRLVWLRLRGQALSRAMDALARQL